MGHIGLIMVLLATAWPARVGFYVVRNTYRRRAHVAAVRRSL